MQRSFVRTFTLASLALVLVLVHSTAHAQYKVAHLVANPARKGSQTYTNLTNGWGIARGAGSPFWVSDNGTGLATLYTETGGAVPLVVTIPWAPGQARGTPTGIVFNGSSTPSEFVVTENNTSGQAMFLFAALIRTLTDPKIPAGFAVYGIQDINRKVYVTFASTGNAPGGFVDVFAENGKFLKQLISGTPLNQPWGLALAPSNFGPFGNALLVGNNTPGGVINAYDVSTGMFLGQLKNQAGRVIQIDRLWGLELGGGTPANGAANELFFTAGPQNYADGLFGSIQPPADAAH
jgi:hypothetical protein